MRLQTEEGHPVDITVRDINIISIRMEGKAYDCHLWKEFYVPLVVQSNCDALQITLDAMKRELDEFEQKYEDSGQMQRDLDEFNDRNKK